MTVKKFPIELEPAYGDYIFVGSDYKEYPEGTEITFTGDLYFDDGLSPLTMYDATMIAPLTKVVEFSALLDIHEEGADMSQISSTEMDGYANGLGCDGHLPEGADDKIKDGTIITWTWLDPNGSGTNCTFTLAPCTDAECN
jgi:hypothetical protein